MTIPEDLLPLSLEQEWFYAARLSRPNERYSLVQAFDISGPLDAQLLMSALRTVAGRHEGLRARIGFNSGGEPGQALHPATEDVPITFQAVACRSQQQFEAYARSLAKAELRARWSPVRDPLYRLRLLRRSPTEHILLATFDHIAFDGRAIATFKSDLWRVYAAGCGARCEEPPAPAERADLAGALLRQHRRYGRRASTVNARYWQERFSVVPPVWQFSGARYRPGTDDKEPQARYFATGKALGDRIRELCAEYRCSVFELCVALFAWTAFRLTWQDRLAFHIPMDSRSAGEREIIGMFSAIYPLVLDRMPGDPREYLAQVKKEGFGASAHRPVQANVSRAATELQRSCWRLRPQRGLAINYFRSDGARADADSPGPLHVRPRQYAPHPPAELPSLALAVRDAAPGLDIGLLYSAGAISEETAVGVLNSIETELRRLGGHSGPAGASMPVPATPDACLTPLHDRQGAVCLHVDLASVRSALIGHPAVSDADVRVEPAATGGTQVVAYLRTTRIVTEDDLEKACTEWPGADQYTVPPARLCHL